MKFNYSDTDRWTRCQRGRSSFVSISRHVIPEARTGLRLCDWKQEKGWKQTGGPKDGGEEERRGDRSLQECRGAEELDDVQIQTHKLIHCEEKNIFVKYHHS